MHAGFWIKDNMIWMFKAALLLLSEADVYETEGSLHEGTRQRY